LKGFLLVARRSANVIGKGFEAELLFLFPGRGRQRSLTQAVVAYHIQKGWIERPGSARRQAGSGVSEASAGRLGGRSELLWDAVLGRFARIFFRIWEGGASLLQNGAEFGDGLPRPHDLLDRHGQLHGVSQVLRVYFYLNGSRVGLSVCEHDL
jgi:hypothetical protein